MLSHTYTPRPDAVTFDTVDPRRLRWLSAGRLAAGKVTVLEGDPGFGKSTLLCEWAARISRGEPLPDGAPGRPRGVLFLAVEDGLADTIRPRLDAAGADAGRIAALRSIDDGSRYSRPPLLPDDLPDVAALARSMDVALIIIDPLVAFLERKLNVHRDQDARWIMTVMTRMAEFTGAAVLLVQHLTKRQRGPAIHHGGSNVGILGPARCGLLLAPDPDNPTVRVLASTKSNLASPPASLAFRMETEPASGAARLTWLGTSNRHADELLATAHHKARTERDEAKDWLQGLLKDGPLPAKNVEALAHQAGFAAKTLRRAREDSNVVTKRRGLGTGSAFYWSLPNATSPPPSPIAHDAHGGQQGQVGQVGQVGQHAKDSPPPR